MLKFSFEKIEGDCLSYALTEDGKKIGGATVRVNHLIKIWYETDEIEKAYAEFTTRSIAFLLRDMCEVIYVDFVDERFKKLGFTQEDGIMWANKRDIKFPGMACSCNE